MQLSRLRGRKITASVQRKGRVWKGKTLVIRWVPGHPPHPAANPSRAAVYVGTLASAKLDKSAVRRNRMRRRCREALRIALLDRHTFPSVQLLLSPRSASLKAPYADIQADIAAFLSTFHA